MSNFDYFNCKECKWGTWVEESDGTGVWTAGCGAEDEIDCELEFEEYDGEEEEEE